MFLSRPSNKPKPNTRFLKHIIKDTDTHNRALLAKESAESRARLEGLEQAEEAKRLKKNPNIRDIRRRQLGDIQSILGSGGRRSRRRDGDEDGGGQSGPSEGSISASKDRKSQPASTREDLTHHQHSRDDRKRHGRLTQNSASSHTSHRHGERHFRKRGSDSEQEERTSNHRSHRDRHRSRSPSRRHKRDCHLSKSSESKQARYRDRSPTSKRHDEHGARRSTRKSPSPPPQRRQNVSGDTESSNGTSDDEIGPMPAPKPRGRGALAGSSGINRRFSESYDPRADVQMDDEDDNSATPANASAEQWDDAVEAYRDQQKLKQNQEARLRSAGFAESHIQKMQAAARGDEKTEADVQWAKAGERREWDRGKVSEDEDEHPPTLLSEDI